MKDEIKQEVQEAVNRLWHSPIEKKYTINHGMKNQYFRHIYNIIDLFGFDLDKKKVTKRYTANQISKFIIALAEETHGKGKTVVKAFEEQKGKFLRELFGSPPEKYQLAFPLNLCQGSYPSDEINSEIKKLDYDKWRTKYYEPAHDQDDTHFKKFLRESPNDLIKHDRRNSKFTYWVTEYEARDPEYALNKVIRLLRLTLGKINYALYKKNTNRTSTSNSPPVIQLSRLQEPFFYLVFHGDEYQFYQPMDYDLRRNCVNSDPDKFDTVEDLPDLPIEDFEPENEESVDDSLIAALFAYQDGIVASTPRQSFFAFWRGTENLTQAGRGEKAEIVDRALAVRDLQHEKIVWKHITDAYDKLEKKRNMLAHEGPHIAISSTDRAAAKLLLDALLEFYFERYSVDYAIDDYRVFLQQLAKQRNEGSDDLEQRKREVEIIEDMREFRKKKLD